MDTLEAAAGQIRGFGERVAQVGEQLRRAAGAAGGADPAALPAVFGLVGADYVAAYTQAHTRFTADVRALAGVADQASTAAHCTACAYASTDAGSALAVEVSA